MTPSINPQGLDIIKRYEGCRLKPYKDPIGIYTIGWGHRGGVNEHTPPINQLDADELLMRDIRNASDIVRANVYTMLNDNQHSALISFVFNVGAGKAGVKDGFCVLKSGKPSTIRTLINAGHMDLAASEFLKWNRAGGQVLAGLTARRAEERALFLKPVSDTEES